MDPVWLSEMYLPVGEENSREKGSWLRYQTQLLMINTTENQSHNKWFTMKRDTQGSFLYNYIL